MIDIPWSQSISAQPQLNRRSNRALPIPISLPLRSEVGRQQQPETPNPELNFQLYQGLKSML